MTQEKSNNECKRLYDEFVHEILNAGKGIFADGEEDIYGWIDGYFVEIIRNDGNTELVITTGGPHVQCTIVNDADKTVLFFYRSGGYTSRKYAQGEDKEIIREFANTYL